MPVVYSSSADATAKSRAPLTVERVLLPAWTHPDVLYWMTEWKMIRDAADGEKAVKTERVTYLPQFDGMDDSEYEAYLARATYYNFTGRTLEALKGTIFRRRFKLSGLPTRFSEDLERISRTGTNLQTFAKFVGKEILTTGRVGVLVDLPTLETVEPSPYVCAYIAENILDWDEATDPQTGRTVLTRVVLREFTLQSADDAKNTLGARRKYVTSYRVLTLEHAQASLKPVYVQRVFSHPSQNADITDEYLTATIYPKVQGQMLEEIPFQFFGALSGGPTIEKPPMIDIARLNLSHYRSYAHLEHGRFYTGFPIYYVETGQGQDGGTTYEIGPSRVWETPTGAKPGIIEFNGQGLRFLESGLTQKEAQAASLGGRMIGVTTTSAAESADSLKMKDRNEQSILLDISQMLDAGFTNVLRWWAIMHGASKDELKSLSVTFNKDFLLDTASSREFRAIHAMYKDGIVPVEVLYEYLSAHEVIPDYMDLEEFTAMLKSPKNFPNQPDAEARAEGFPNKQSQLDNELKQEEQDLKKEAQDAQIEATKRAAEQNHALMQQGLHPSQQQQPPGQPGGPPQQGKPVPGKPGVKPAPKPAKTGNTGGKGDV